MNNRQNVSLFGVLKNATLNTWRYAPQLLPFSLLISLLLLIVNSIETGSDDPMLNPLHSAGFALLNQWVILPFWGAGLLIFMLWIISLIGLVMMVVRWQQEVQYPAMVAPAHIIGKTWRAIVSTALLMAFSMLGAVLVFILTFKSAAVDWLNAGIINWLGILVAVVASLWLMYMTLRLSLYGIAIVLEDASIIRGFKRSLQLNQGRRQWVGTAVLFGLQQLLMVLVGFLMLFFPGYLSAVHNVNASAPTVIWVWLLQLFLGAAVLQWSVVCFLEWYQELAARSTAANTTTLVPEA